jgi:hypothetical protein
MNMEDLNLVLIALAAFAGGILAAFLGWLNSNEPFAPRKFGRSVGFALLAGIGFAGGYSFADSIGARDLFAAVLAGAGVDVISNRALGAARSGVVGTRRLGDPPPAS